MVCRKGLISGVLQKNIKLNRKFGFFLMVVCLL